MVQKGGCKSLIQLLERSADQECQRFSALALGNIASCAENRIPIVEEGVLRPLINYVRNEDGDVIGRQYAALALGNLASDPENHEEIVKVRKGVGARKRVGDRKRRGGRWRDGEMGRYGGRNRRKRTRRRQGAEPTQRA